MSLLKIMKDNDIAVNWVFTQAKFHDKEGLFFFEPIVKENDDGEEEHYLEAKCILIDDAKFVYGDDMEKEITINLIEGKIVFNRVDGTNVSISEAEFSGFPFKLVEFGKTVKHVEPVDFVEIE